MSLAPIAVTAGEPAGIGFDIILQAIQELRDCIIIADKNALLHRAQHLQIPIEFCTKTPSNEHQLWIEHIATRVPVECGKLNPENSAYVLSCLDRALQGTQTGEYAAIVTGPVHKGVINEAGFAFTGHTEYFSEHTRSEVVMLLVANNVRVALATTHLPLNKVADAISRDLLIEKLSIVHTGLINKFGIQHPHIAVCGLNPHAGEQGHLGTEEVEIIEPAIRYLQETGMNISGPHPADTIFVPTNLQSVDAVMAMYHDQGLPVLKHIGFGHAVNTSLGLPIIRTSVDHGTALDLAGTGESDAGSLIAAIQLAREQVTRNNIIQNI